MRWLAVVAATAAAGVVLVVALQSSSPHLVASPLHASFQHPVVGFGDRVHARVTVVVRAQDAGGHLNVNVAPLEQLGPARVTRVTGNGLVSLTYDADAVCSVAECLGKGGRKLVHLPDVTLLGVRDEVIARASWPPLDVRGRVVAADLAPTEPRLRADVVAPPVDYRIAPHTLATVLTVLAALLAAGGVALAGRQVAAVRRARLVGLEPLTELERALQLAREAESRGAADRRRALALLERLLGSRDAHLAHAARDLAWRSPPPDAEALSDLVDDIESKVER